MPNLRRFVCSAARIRGLVALFWIVPGAYAPDRRPQPSISAGVEVFMLPLAPQASAERATVSEAIPSAWKFDFGPGAIATGYTRVMPQNIYNRESGFGFEPGSQIACINRGGKDSLRTDFCTSDKPFY